MGSNCNPEIKMRQGHSNRMYLALFFWFYNREKRMCVGWWLNRLMVVFRKIAAQVCSSLTCCKKVSERSVIRHSDCWSPTAHNWRGGYIQMTNDTVGLCPNILLFHIYNGFWYIWWGLVGVVGGVWGVVCLVGFVCGTNCTAFFTFEKVKCCIYLCVYNV